MKDKTDSHLDESSATDKPGSDDLEVDNILSHSKVEQQTSAEHRANLIVSCIPIVDWLAFIGQNEKEGERKKCDLIQSMKKIKTINFFLHVERP